MLGSVLRLMDEKRLGFALANQNIGDASRNKKDVDKHDGEAQRQHDGPMLFGQALY